MWLVENLLSDHRRLILSLHRTSFDVSLSSISVISSPLPKFPSMSILSGDARQAASPRFASFLLLVAFLLVLYTRDAALRANICLSFRGIILKGEVDGSAESSSGGSWSTGVREKMGERGEEGVKVRTSRSAEPSRGESGGTTPTGRLTNTTSTENISPAPSAASSGIRDDVAEGAGDRTIASPGPMPPSSGSSDTTTRTSISTSTPSTRPASAPPILSVITSLPSRRPAQSVSNSTTSCPSPPLYTPGCDGTFAQNYQDTWVVRVAQANGWDEGFFLDLGAFKGEECSNTALLERKLNWKGICVEPRPAPNAFATRNCVLAQRPMTGTLWGGPGEETCLWCTVSWERGTRREQGVGRVWAGGGRICQRVGGVLAGAGVTPGYWALRLLIQTGGVVVPRNSSSIASLRCFSLS